MELASLIKGIIFGFSIAAPVGPIGILCIRRTLVNGILTGFVSGLGAATADALYGSIAAFGLTVISNFLIGQQIYIRLIGSLFLLYLGYTTFKSPPAKQSNDTYGNDAMGAYISTFFLTVTNPMTILSFTAIFAGLGAGNTKTGCVSTVSLVAGVLLGSALWWLTLSCTVSIIRSKLDSCWLKWVNRLSGAIIIGFAVINMLKII